MNKYDEFIKLGEEVRPTTADVEGSQRLACECGHAYCQVCAVTCCDCARSTSLPTRSSDASGYVRGLEDAARIAENLKDGFTCDVWDGTLERDPDGPWHLGSEVAKAIRALISQHQEGTK